MEWSQEIYASGCRQIHLMPRFTRELPGNYKKPLVVIINQTDMVATQSISSCGGMFQRTFSRLIPLRLPVLSQRVRKWLNPPSMVSHNLWTSRRKAYIQQRTDHG